MLRSELVLGLLLLTGCAKHKPVTVPQRDIAPDCQPYGSGLWGDEPYDTVRPCEFRSTQKIG